MLQREKSIFSSLESKFLLFNHFGTLLWLPEKNKTQHGVSLIQAQMDSNIRLVSLDFILSSASSLGPTHAPSQADVVILGHQLLLVIVVHEPNEIPGAECFSSPTVLTKGLQWSLTGLSWIKSYLKSITMNWLSLGFLSPPGANSLWSVPFEPLV